MSKRSYQPSAPVRRSRNCTRPRPGSGRRARLSRPMSPRGEHGPRPGRLAASERSVRPPFGGRTAPVSPPFGGVHQPRMYGTPTARAVDENRFRERERCVSTSSATNTSSTTTRELSGSGADCFRWLVTSGPWSRSAALVSRSKAATMREGRPAALARTGTSSGQTLDGVRSASVDRVRRTRG